MGPAVISGDLSVSREWQRAIFGVGIGATGLSVADIDADGDQEVVAAAGTHAFWSNSYWYVVSREGAGYAQTWVSPPYPASIQAVRVAQADGDAALEVLVASGNQLQVYDGSTLSVQQTLTLPTSTPVGLTVADVDADGSRELVFCDSSRLYIMDLASGAVEFNGASLGGKDLAVGQVDGDAALEIIIANGSSAGYVVDGQTRAIQWTNASGFGDIVRVGDIDSDGLAEIIAGFTWTTGLRVYQGDIQTLAYSVPVSNLGAVRVADVEGDGPLELIYGDAQWGSVHVLNGATGVQKWALANPEHGVTDIAVGNVDGDAAREILWGAGYSSSGADHLYVADAVTRTRDWESQDITGPFYALGAGDVDADGRTELLYGSFESDSGYGDGLFFIHDGASKALEYQSGEPTGSNLTGLWRIRSANVDSDAQQEVFVSTSSGYDGLIICYDGLTHAEQWRSAGISGASIRGMQLADVDGDGALEVVASVGIEHTGALGAFVYVYDAATGALEWQSPALSGSWQQLSLLRVANVDADAAQEIVVADLGVGLWIIDAATRTVQLTTADLDITALETADLNGDRRSEVIIGTAAGALKVLDVATGAVSQTLYTSSAQINGLAVADLSADGTPDYVFASGNQLRLVNGASRTEEWSSGVIGADVGAQDGLFLANIDTDSRTEIGVNTGLTGFMIYEVAAGVASAAYDATLRVPRCSTPGVSCDSGLLLLGRGTVGPELNAPNTLFASCADGTSGAYHSDESNDRLRIVSLDGTRFAPGKTVRIEATVWAWSGSAADVLDLYSAADANTPVWQYITSVPAGAGGAQTLTATYVLPAGKLQAIRARFRYQGSPAPCGTGPYDDHDDLVFAVQ